MDPKTYETLRIMITTCALLYDPTYDRVIEQERLQAQRLSDFIPQRLTELNSTPQDLADTLEIEIEFIQTLLDATFPISVISHDMWHDLAAALRCSVSTLHQVRFGIIGSSASL